MSNDNALVALKSVINNARQTVRGIRSTSNFEIIQESLQNKAVKMVESFFYCNVINNFKNNLTEENMNEFKIRSIELSSVMKSFGKLFQQCKDCLQNGCGKEYILKEDYDAFKKELKKIGEGAYKLLIEVEKLADFGSGENEIDNFKKELKKSGKKIKIKTMDDEKESADEDEKEDSIKLIAKIGFG